MSTYEAVKYNFVGSAITGIVAIEVGTILPWSNSTLPSGYLNCDGSAVSRSTYSALFAIIASDYGNGDGSSTFNLPDLQDKVPLGVSGSKAVASTGGSASVTPSGSITIGAITPSGNVAGSTGSHTILTSQMPSHNHSGKLANNSANYVNPGFTENGGNWGHNNMGNAGGSGSHAHNMSANFSGSAVTPTGNFSGSSLSALQPYIAIKFMIKV